MPRRTPCLPTALSVALLSAGPIGAQQPAPQPAPAGQRIEVSGGPLLPEQAADDITFYDLALRITPSDSSIAGALAARP